MEQSLYCKLVADSTQSTGLKWAAAAGGGKILQVVQATTSTAFTTTSTTYVDITNLTASITPSATTSKVLVFVSLNSFIERGGDNGHAQFNLVRGSTSIYTTDYFGYFENGKSATWNLQTVNGLHYLDSPSTTSSTTYKMQVKTDYNVSTFKSNTNSGTSTIILMEVGA